MPAKKEETKKKQMTQMSLQIDSSMPEKNTIHKRSGLIFPVSRVLGLMKSGRFADRITTESAISITAVLEYLTAEILETSGDSCFDGKKQIAATIKPRHICLAVKGDEELNRAIGPHVIIPMGGVIPFIHEELEQNLKKKKKNKNKALDKLKDDEAAEDSDEETTESEEA